MVKKLRIQAGHRLLFLNTPEGYVEWLVDLPENVEVSEEPKGKYEFVQLFVKNGAEYSELSLVALQTVKYDGLLWISYPKRGSKVETNLTRDVLWKITEDTGLRPVTQVSVDNVWSALRLRPTEMVKK